jgi:phage portal protein BeeE
MIRRLLGLFKTETRAVSGSGYTAQLLAEREAYISGRRGLAELTSAAQGAISLWEGAMTQADVRGTDLLPPATLALATRSLALRGEAVFLVRDRLVPCSDWDVTTREGLPVAYRLTVPDTGGGRTVTALAGEVIHLRIGSDPVTPWAGTPPLRRSSLSAGLLHAIEAALSEVFECAPLGSAIVPFPESPDVEREKLARSFKGQRGRVLLRESVSTTAAGGPSPQTDWKPSDLSPDLSRSMAVETMTEARAAIAHAFGLLPAALDPKAAGPLIREAQRHLASWTLQPIAELVAQEATEKLGAPVSLDVLQPLQAYDAGGRARAMKGAVDAMAAAKEAGLSDEAVAAAARFAGVPSGE